jgi:hypothetical protein
MSRAHRSTGEAQRKDGRKGTQTPLALAAQGDRITVSPVFRGVEVGPFCRETRAILFSTPHGSTLDIGHRDWDPAYPDPHGTPKFPYPTIYIHN